MSEQVECFYGSHCLRIARSLGSIRLDASLPEDGTGANFRNVLIFKAVLECGQFQKKEIVSVSHTLSSKPYSFEYRRPV